MVDAVDAVIVPLVTPSNMKDLLKLVDHVLSGGVHSILLFGTTGEGKSILLEKKKAWIEQVVNHVGKKAKLYIGLVCQNIEEAIDLAHFCEKHHFAGGLLPVALYQDGGLEHFLEKTKLKIILYNTPQNSSLDVKKLVPLKDEKRLLGIKDSSGNFDLLKQLVKDYRTKNFKVYYGREYKLDEALKISIDGIFPGTGNVIPDISMELWKKKDAETYQAFRKEKTEIEALAPNHSIEGIKKRLLQLNIL